MTTTTIPDRVWTGTCPEWCEHANDNAHQEELDATTRSHRELMADARKREPGVEWHDLDGNYGIFHTRSFRSGPGWRVGYSSLQWYGEAHAIEAGPDVYVDDDQSIQTPADAASMARALTELAEFMKTL